MANTLTALTPTIFTAVRVVARELVGFIPAVFRNTAAARVAVGQAVTYPIVLPGQTFTITPGQLPPDNGDITPTAGTMTVEFAEGYPIRWTGEEELLMSETGIYDNVITQQFAQGFRALSNKIELDLATKAYKGASRAFGTPGTAPFGTNGDFTDFAKVNEMLDQNGASPADRQLVLGSAAIGNIRGKQQILFKANEAGTDDLLRRGIIGQVQGLDIHNSAQVPIAVVAGTGASYLVNNGAGYAIGAQSIALDTGTGTILAGDTITFAGDTNKYVVEVALAAGVVKIAEPGLKKALADNAAVTVGAAFTPNIAHVRSAVHLLARTPAMPKRGDMATDVMDVTDPFTGLVFQVAHYGEYRRSRIEIGIAWGSKVVQPDHVVELLG